MLKRSLLCVIFLLFRCQNGSGEELDCPELAPNFSNNSRNFVEGRYEGYSDVLNGSLVEKLRSTKTELFYQNIVNNVVMFLCDVKSASERCVDKDSLLATKNWKGDCVEAADFTCPTGLCERTSNCYWNSVKQMENRTTRFPVDDYASAKEVLYGLTSNSYAGEIAIVGSIGVIVSLVLLIFWLVFFIIRYMCCCLWSFGTLCFLCSPTPKNRYKTCSDKIAPILLYVIALVGVTVSALVAFLGNEQVSVAVSNAFLHADGLLDDVQSFLQRSRIPLTNINDIVGYAALDAKLIFDGTDYVTRDASEIMSSFLGFSSLHSEGLLESNALLGLNKASTGFEEKVSPITSNVQSMLDTLEHRVYDQADTIKGGITSALSQLDSFTNQSSDWQIELYRYEGGEFGLRTTRRVIVMSSFIASFLFGVLGLVAIVLSKNQSCSNFFSMLKITGFFSAIMGSLAIICASVLLCVSFFLFDACQMSEIFTRDFEPFVGDRVAPGANACFNDTNLAVAFNVTEKVDFQRQLDEGLFRLESINVTSSFELVLEPLEHIQELISSTSNSALYALNQATSSNSTLCPFGDIYTKLTMLEPWNLARANDVTPYIIRDNFGNATSFKRSGTEDSLSYFSRIYNKAGVCSSSSSCCIQLTPTPPATCDSDEPDDDCDHGTNCMYPCEALKFAILEGHAAFISLYDKEQRMTADLGVLCPPNDTCPTNEFKLNYSNVTLVAQVQNYKTKISSTKDTLVALASTSVGDAMIEVQDFLCHMNASFVERRYDEVKNDICGKAFFGIEMLMWSLYALGICLEFIAIVSHVLCVRLSPKYKSGLTRADVYGGG